MADNCKGLLGRILGHNYEPVIETDYTGSDLKLTAEEISAFSKMSFGETALEHYANTHEKYTERYVGHCCSRCGDAIKMEQKK